MLAGGKETGGLGGRRRELNKKRKVKGLPDLPANRNTRKLLAKGAPVPGWTGSDEDLKSAVGLRLDHQERGLIQLSTNLEEVYRKSNLKRVDEIMNDLNTISSDDFEYLRGLGGHVTSQLTKLRGNGNDFHIPPWIQLSYMRRRSRQSRRFVYVDVKTCCLGRRANGWLEG